MQTEVVVVLSLIVALVAPHAEMLDRLLALLPDL